MATHKIRVVVPPREGHPGTWAAGELWTPDGNETDVEVSDEQLRVLAARPGIVVLQNGKPIKASAPPASRIHTTQLTADEMRVVEEYRAREADKPKGGQQSSVQITATGESAEDAAGRALAEASSSGGAQSPLDNREILMGQQTAGGHGFTGDATSGEQRPKSNDDLKPKHKK